MFRDVSRVYALAHGPTYYADSSRRAVAAVRIDLADDADLRDVDVRVRFSARRRALPGRNPAGVSLFPLREPDAGGGGREVGRHRRRGNVAALQLRHGRDFDRRVHAAQRGRRSRVRVGDLRRHVSSHRASAAALRRQAALRVARGAARPRARYRTEDAAGLVRVADQSDPALCRHPPHHRRLS